MTNPDPAKIIEAAVRLWKVSGLLQLKFANTPEMAIIKELCADPSNYETRLIELLGHHNQMVVAYALLTLEKMGSAVISNPPEFLTNDTRKVMKSMGSFAPYITIGKFLRELQQNERTGQP